MSQPIGTLIWISVRPMLRLVLCASAGFIITKADLLPPIAARGAGQITLNIAFPALFFSKIVPAFTPENISNLGPLVVVCLLYQLIGLLTCLVILPFFWVPHRFRYGFLVAGMFGNYGDLPTAVIMSVTAAAPFNGTEDQNLAVAYIAAFVLVFMITLFPMGGHHLVAMDFQGPEKEDHEVRRSVVEKLREDKVVLSRISQAVITHSRPWRHYQERSDVEASCIQQENIEREEVGDQVKEKISGDSPMLRRASSSARPSFNPSSSVKTIPKHVAFSREDSTAAPSDTELPSCKTSPIYTSTIQGVSTSPPPLADTAPSLDIFDSRSSAWSASRVHTFRHKLVAFLRTLLNVPTVVVIISFIISVIQPVKGLFVLLPSSPKAPDGQPPLAFILDTATFLGGASVPMGLICLGSALARLNVPRGEWQNLPIGAILCLAVGRMVLQPVIGVLLVQGLTQVGLISAEDKVLRFVCIFFSCVPTATTQVYLTQVYSGTGSAEHLSAFLIPQYILMFISSTTLTAFTLHLLFG